MSEREDTSAKKNTSTYAKGVKNGVRKREYEYSWYKYEYNVLYSYGMHPKKYKLGRVAAVATSL